MENHKGSCMMKRILWIVIVLMCLLAIVAFLVDNENVLKYFQSVTGTVKVLELRNTSASGDVSCGRCPDIDMTSSRNVPYMYSVALAFGVTTRQKLGKVLFKLDKTNMFERMPLFKTLIPSFCDTVSPHYDYHFFIAYDHDDPSLTHKAFFQDVYNAATEMFPKRCNKDSRYTIHFVKIGNRDPSHQVTWSQNAAAMEAYYAGVDYIYRITDDTIMKTPGWTETFIGVLQSFVPPNIGVCGPKHNGNQNALTYEFVHRTHIDIIGMYYLVELRNWDGDVWLTDMYKPDNSKQVDHISVVNTQAEGVRYDTKLAHISKEKRKTDVKVGHDLFQRYVKALPLTPQSTIVLSLNTSNPDQLKMVVRMAQLRRVLFPDWSMKIYVSPDVIHNPTNDISSESYINRPGRVMYTLKLLGAQITSVTGDLRKLSSDVWKYLAIDDLHVEYLLFCDNGRTFNDKEAEIISRWISSPAGSSVENHRPSELNGTNNSTVAETQQVKPEQSDKNEIAMCIIDKSKTTLLPIQQHLCVLNLKKFKTVFNTSVKSSVLDYVKHHEWSTSKFLEDVVWPIVKNVTVTNNVDVHV